MKHNLEQNKPFRKANRPDDFIEQYSNGIANFGTQCTVSISPNGLGVDKVFFKFVLPQLPPEFNYKKFCVYDLIGSLELMIGEISIFKFNSKQLQMFDKVEHNINDIIKCASVNNNIILYPFDLKSFFGKSKSDDINLVSKLDMGFEGFRLDNCDCTKHEMKFIIRFGKILNIIENLNVIDNQLDILKKIKLVDFVTKVHYVGMQDKHEIEKSASCHYFLKKWPKNNFLRH